VSARKAKAPHEPRIGDESHAILRKALESTRIHVAEAADSAKAATAESNSEVTRARRLAHEDGPEDLQTIANAQRGHAKAITSIALDHTTAIDDLMRDLAELFDI